MTTTRDTASLRRACRTPSENFFIKLRGRTVEADAPLATIWSPDDQRQRASSSAQVGELRFPPVRDAPLRVNNSSSSASPPRISRLEKNLTTLTICHRGAPPARAPSSRNPFTRANSQGQATALEIADFSSMWFVLDATTGPPGSKLGEKIEIHHARRSREVIQTTVEFIDPNFNENHAHDAECVRRADPSTSRDGSRTRLRLAVLEEGTVLIESPAVLEAPRSAVDRKRPRARRLRRMGTVASNNARSQARPTEATRSSRTRSGAGLKEKESVVTTGGDPRTAQQLTREAGTPDHSPRCRAVIAFRPRRSRTAAPAPPKNLCARRRRLAAPTRSARRFRTYRKFSRRLGGPRIRRVSQ